MGRKPSRWDNLPKGMRARPRGNKVFYYLDTGGKPRKEIPLGSDYTAAVQQWADLTSRPSPVVTVHTFDSVAQEYWKTVIPTKSPQTQADNEKERAWLNKFFNDPPAPLDEIKPVHIRSYLDWRVKTTREAAIQKNRERAAEKKPPLAIKDGRVRANREKALFSHIWNFAREYGYTDKPNPCLGVKGFEEVGRDVYVDDALIQSVKDKASEPLRFALDLAHLTGQRPGDVLRMSETDLNAGMLHVRQGKTKAKLRIMVEGELARLIEAMTQYKASVTKSDKVRQLSLLVNERGEKYTSAMLRNDFDAARNLAGIDKGAFQFRDLRAKAATDADDSEGIRKAQALLGHTTEGMTADYVRHKLGKKVRPLK